MYGGYQYVQYRHRKYSTRAVGKYCTYYSNRFIRLYVCAYTYVLWKLFLKLAPRAVRTPKFKKKRLLGYAKNGNF